MSTSPTAGPMGAPIRDSVFASIHVNHPFDLEPAVEAENLGLDLIAEESLEYQFQEAGCNNTFSTVACDCATTLSTIFCYGCGGIELGCGGESC